ncbi:ABC-three component system middle component 7 [Pedobacter sp. WC2501]|uniref:ABC-three component system middle component 7 n=1 Tax=Pedobacter sp. WC2501 TaxID=3461400 RepID=UPI004045ECF5
MIYPNKNIRFEESIIFKMLSILEELKRKEFSITEMYHRTLSNFKNPDEYIYALDVLYILDMIELNYETETLRYVKGN